MLEQQENQLVETEKKSEEKKLHTVSPLGGFVAQATNRDLVKEKQEQLSKPKEEKVASEDVKPVEVKRAYCSIW